MAKKLPARKSSKTKRKASSRPRARKNPAAWKFAVAVPVVAGVGYLLYKYVFMNEAQAAELVEGSGTATQTPAAQIPASSTSTSPQVPASGSAPSGAEGASAPAGPSGSTTLPGTSTSTRPQLPTSGQACFAGTAGGMNIKIQWMFDAKGAKGVVYKDGKEAAKISAIRSGYMASHAGELAVSKLFKLRSPVSITDSGMSHNGWTLTRTVC